jgi:cytochrome c-type biogenesis protein CcmH/NrfG
VSAAGSIDRLATERHVLNLLAELARRGVGAEDSLAYAERALALSRQLAALQQSGDGLVIADLTALGSARVAAGDLKGARRTFADAVAILDAQVRRDPRDTERLYTYGLLFTFRAALERLEADPQAAESRAKAIDYVQRSLALVPGDSGAWALLASIHLEAGEFAEFSQALAKFPAETDDRVATGYRLVAASLAGDVEAVQRALEAGVGAEDVSALIYATLAFANAGDVGHARQLAQMVAARKGLVLDDWPYGKGAALVKEGPLAPATQKLISDYEGALHRGEPQAASAAFARFAEALAQGKAP